MGWMLWKNTNVSYLSSSDKYKHFTEWKNTRYNTIFEKLKKGRMGVDWGFQENIPYWCQIRSCLGIIRPQNCDERANAQKCWQATNKVRMRSVLHLCLISAFCCTANNFFYYINHKAKGNSCVFSIMPMQEHIKKQLRKQTVYWPRTKISYVAFTMMKIYARGGYA